MRNRRLTVYVLMLLCFSMLLTHIPLATMAQTQNVALGELSADKVVNNFRTEAVYLDDADQPFGGRFVHARTGFTLDYLQIQSVPQVFLWVNSFPTSDMGEPHTQEHLLLGKGNIGRAHSSFEGMSLAGSSAFTQQWRTAYHLHTAAGPEVFYKLFESQVNALLHPDYTDEEIRREVRNWGVSETPGGGPLRLEEKGTVYQEMTTTFDRPVSRLFRAANQMLYGERHPLAVSSGGFPSSIREMQPADIRKFHADNYHLGNMGMVASFPKEMPLGDVLRRLNEILNRLEPQQQRRRFTSETDLPAPQAAPPGKIQIVEYPHKNEQQPGWVMFAWPATLKLDTQEELLLNLFLDNVAGDATTNLYKLFIDTKTRQMDLGATGVFAFLDDEMVVGHPVYMGLTDVTPANMTDEKIALVRQKIMDEMRRIASFKDGSPELAEFNARLRNRVIQSRRTLSKLVNSPPGFGFRNTDSSWMTHLQRLNRAQGYRKSVTMKPELAFVENLLGSNRNFWSQYITKWRLAEATPYAVAARPSPQVIQRDEQEKQARAAAEIARLKAKYGADDEQEAIRRYKAEYDRTTAELEQLAKQQNTNLRFVENPPLTLDDQLDFKVTTPAGGVKLVASTFDNMTSATTGLALRLDGVPENELVYLSMMPALLTGTGVIRDGKPVSYEEMSEMLRKEILALNAYFSTNFRTNRAELVVRGAGNDAAESERAIEWMKLVLYHPDWRPENLPRIRDLVDQTLSGMRNRMQGAEEAWVNNPADAYWRQDNPLLLSVSSFLTQAHNVHRLRWMLKDAGQGADRDAISNFLERLAGAGGNRDELKMLLGAIQGKPDTAGKVSANLAPHVEEFKKLPQTVSPLAVEAAKDLERLLADIPDATLAADWAYLAREIRHDLLVPPAQALANLDSVRQRLLRTGGARMFMTASRATQGRLDASVRSLLAGLENGAVTPAKYSSTRIVEARLRSRVGERDKPVFVGLMNPNTQGGVFLNSAPSVSYFDTDREQLLDYLASRLYAGRGAHAIFIKTWGAGLAYSNGFRGSPSIGRMGYYAERTPELPQTLRFVIDEIKKAQPDPSLVEYAVAVAFSEFRSASPYEVRGEAMANDLADGLTPDVVSRFRRAILDLRRTPNLSDELFKRMGKVYAQILPGYGTRAADVAGGVYYVIGPEKQLAAYEQYLKSVEGADARLYRIYPRDYWMTLKEAETSGGDAKKAGGGL